MLEEDRRTHGGCFGFHGYLKILWTFLRSAVQLWVALNVDCQSAAAQPSLSQTENSGTLGTRSYQRKLMGMDEQLSSITDLHIDLSLSWIDFT